MTNTFSGLPITGASGAISGRRSIDGGSQTSLSGFIGEIGGGQYVVNLYDFDLNGKNIGFLFTASGAVAHNVTVITTANVSGKLFPNSGLPLMDSSGFLKLASGSLSGQLVTASLNSGQSVLVYSGQMSGQQVNLLSGNVVEVNSGTQVNLFSGTQVGLFSGSMNTLANNLLDAPNGVESGMTLRQGQRVQLAAAGGKLSGAGSTNIRIRDTNDTVNRINATVDASGNRTSILYDLT